MRFSSTPAVASSSIALMEAAQQSRKPQPLGHRYQPHRRPGCAVGSFQSAWRMDDLDGSERNGQSNQMDK
jgi:hypothetical protein